MLWLCALAVSWLTRQNMQPQHQRQSLNQNEGVFVVFFYFLLVSKFHNLSASLLDLCQRSFGFVFSLIGLCKKAYGIVTAIVNTYYFR
jgi:uncharacterized membrane protein